jgi:hypothetical protein
MDFNSAQVFLVPPGGYTETCKFPKLIFRLAVYPMPILISSLFALRFGYNGEYLYERVNFNESFI